MPDILTLSNVLSLILGAALGAFIGAPLGYVAAALACVAGKDEA